MKYLNGPQLSSFIWDAVRSRTSSEIGCSYNDILIMWSGPLQISALQCVSFELTLRFQSKNIVWIILVIWVIFTFAWQPILHFYSFQNNRILITYDYRRVHDVVLKRIPPRMKSWFVVGQLKQATLDNAASKNQSHLDNVLLPLQNNTKINKSHSK